MVESLMASDCHRSMVTGPSSKMTDSMTDCFTSSKHAQLNDPTQIKLCHSFVTAICIKEAGSRRPIPPSCLD